jgi:hypothetical protein
MYRTATLTSGSSLTFSILPNTGTGNVVRSQRSFQVTAEGVGTLTFGIKLQGMTSFEDFLILTGKTEIADLVGVTDVRISAAGGDVTYVIAVYNT